MGGGEIFYRAICKTRIFVTVSDRLWNPECEVQYHRRCMFTALDCFTSSSQGAYLT